MGAYRSLKAYQHAMTLAAGCILAARKFPPEEQHRLADQLRRAAQSVVLNIAEGSGRISSKDQRRFYETARTSLDEVEAILELSGLVGYVEAVELLQLQSQREETAKTHYGLLRSVSDRAKPRPPKRRS